jgi:hypothetical protein
VPYKFAAYSSPERLAEAAKKRESWDVRETVDDAAGVDPAVKVPPFRLFAIPPSRSRPARARERDDARLQCHDAVMSDFTFFGLEFLKA